MSLVGAYNMTNIMMRSIGGTLYRSYTRNPSQAWFAFAGQPKMSAPKSVERKVTLEDLERLLQKRVKEMQRFRGSRTSSGCSPDPAVATSESKSPRTCDDETAFKGVLVCLGLDRIMHGAE